MTRMRYNDEFQVEIVDVNACGGSCPGCMLSVTERQVDAPSMSRDTRRKALFRIREYLDCERPEVAKSGRVNLLYGVADHLLMPDAYLSEIFADGEQLLVESGCAQRSLMCFTTSLIGRPEHVVRKLTHALSMQGQVPIWPIFALDPIKLDHPIFGPRYLASIEAALKVSPNMSVVVNLSLPIVRSWPPSRLKTFLRAYGFQEPTINWIPTADNWAHTASDIGAISQWLVAFGRDADVSTAPQYLRSALRGMIGTRQTHGEKTLMQVVRDNIATDLYGNIRIAEQGQVYPRFNAIGDIAYDERVKRQAMGTIFDQPLADVLRAAQDGIERQVLQAYFGTRACLACEHQLACGATGLHMYNRIVSPTDSGCPHVAHDLMTYLNALDPAVTAEIMQSPMARQPA